MVAVVLFKLFDSYPSLIEALVVDVVQVFCKVESVEGSSFFRCFSQIDFSHVQCDLMEASCLLCCAESRCLSCAGLVFNSYGK